MIWVEHGIYGMLFSHQIISEMLPKIRTIEKLDFFQIYNVFENNVVLCFI